MDKIENTLEYIMQKYDIPAEPDELDAVLHDYQDLAKQNKKMIERYFQPDRPVKRNDVWCCPDCGNRVAFNHSHCHWCGKKLGWDRLQR